MQNGSSDLSMESWKCCTFNPFCCRCSLRRVETQYFKEMEKSNMEKVQNKTC